MTLQFKSLVLGSLLLWGSSLLAQNSGSDSLRQTMTTSIQYDIGSNTYESDTASSKESSQGDTFTFSTAAGQNRLVGISIRSARNNVNFALNDSKMTTRWQDLMISYRMGWFTPAVGAALSEVQIETDSGDYVDIYRASLGAGLGMRVPLWHHLVVYGDFRFFEKPPTPKFASLTNSSDAVPDGTARKLDATLDSRNEFDIGTSVDISRDFLDFVVGYRVKSYDLIVEGVKNSEYQAGIYAGFKIGAYF